LYYTGKWEFFKWKSISFFGIVHLGYMGYFFSNLMSFFSSKIAIAIFS